MKLTKTTKILALATLCLTSMLYTSCAVYSVGSTAVKTTGKVVKTTGKVAVGTGKAITPDGKDKKEEEEKK